MSNFIVALLGKSASGKDTILAELEKKGYKRVVSCTTRPMRDGEIEGKDYYFLTEEQFHNRMDNFIEHRSYSTFDKDGNSCIWHYGIEESEINLKESSHVVVVDYKGLKDLQKYSDRVLAIFINAPANERYIRAKMRDSNFSPHEWVRREQDDLIVFEDLSLINAIVLNEDGHFGLTMDSIDSILFFAKKVIKGEIT